MHFSSDPARHPEDAEVQARLGPAAEARLKDRYYYDYFRKIKAIAQ